MDARSWLNKFVFLRTRDIKPDGRPLYAYKCRIEEYETLKTIIAARVKAADEDCAFQLEALFCLFAAEAWRRCHVGGPWKWETVFNEIGHPVPEHSRLRALIQNGLHWWGRPLLLSRSGSREFLVTIACEGGLPLRLLQTENAHLNRYFRQLLTSSHQGGCHLGDGSPSADDDQLARQLSTILPPSLRHDIVFSLSSELIRKIVDLQQQVVDAPDPIAALDQQDIDWRNSLPLPLEDDTIDRLLHNLVNEARTLSITARQKITWRRSLAKRNEGWTVEQVLEVPVHVSGSTLQAWTQKESFPTRLRFFLYTINGFEQIAWLTRLKGEGADTLYRCEILRRSGVKLVDQGIEAGAQLHLSDGRTEYPLTVQGDQELGPLPWFFKDGEKQLEFLGEGPARCKENAMYVLVPSGGDFTGDGTSTKVGDAPGTKRLLFKLTGSGVWKHPELGTCRYQCASPEESSEIFVLDGPRLPVTAEDVPPFLGGPNLGAVNKNGRTHQISGARMEWRPVNMGGAAWQSDVRKCAGEVWVRYFDAHDNQLLLRKVRVVPANFQVAIENIGVAPGGAGTIRIKGLGAGNVQCHDITGCSFDLRPLADGVAIDTFMEHGLPVTQFSCTISWGMGRVLTLQLPFPRKGAAFVQGTTLIPEGGRVAAARLTAVHAIIQAPFAGGLYHLNVKITSHHLFGRNFTINERITLDDNGRGRFDLHRIQERLSSMLALTGNLDAVAELKIDEMNGDCLARMEVGLFGFSFAPDYDANVLNLASQSIEQLKPDWEQRLDIKMMKLWQPGAEPVKLERNGAALAWTIPENLEPGPWMVLGEEGDWPCFRPTLWNIEGQQQDQAIGLLAQTIFEPDRQMRKSQFYELIRQMGKDPNHPTWSEFSDYLKMTLRYPASVFDLFRFFVKKPKAMLLALLKSEDDDFDAVWSLAFQLPFSWHLFPVLAWRSAASLYFSSLREALSTLEQGEAIVWQQFQRFRERITTRQPFFRQICDWLSMTIFPERHLTNSELSLAKQAPGIILGFIQEEERKLQARHDADERYPGGPFVMEWLHHEDYPDQFRYQQMSKPFRPVRCAPFVAAHIALTGARYEKPVLFELQRLRRFDKEWFDSAYAFALCIGLAGAADHQEEGDN